MQLEFAEIAPVAKKAKRAEAKLPPAAQMEVASIWKAEFLAPIAINEFPNFSAVISGKAGGDGLRFYDTMLGTDADLAGCFQDLYDDVLHYPWIIRAASESPEHQLHARFVEFAIKHIPQHQNVLRYLLDSYARGFAVGEKIYEVITRGEWAGAAVYREIIDKPQRWFTFDIDRRLRLKTSMGAQPGELLAQEKFVVTTYGTNNSPWGKPMLDLAYWAWFLKHHAMKNQAIHFEKWAQPTGVAKYAWSADVNTSRKNKEAALQVLQALQVDQSIAIPEGMKLELLESLRNGSISYERYIDQLTSMESRIITGQTLTTSGEDGGSYALGKVHERKEKNRVITIGRFLSSQVSRHFSRELVDRNFGPQDTYPQFEVLVLSAAERQAEAAVEAAQMKNGHRLSRAWSARRTMIVGPMGDEDLLTPPPELINQPSMGVAAELAANAEKKVALAAAPAELLDEMHGRANAIQGKLEGIGKSAAKQARGAFRKIVRGLASVIRGKKKLEKINRETLFKALQDAPIDELGQVYDRMLGRPERVSTTLAQADQPPSISTGAKLALGLSLLAIVDRFLAAVEQARQEGRSAAELADAVADPNDFDIDGHFARIFDAVHETNIVSISAARLQQQLQNPDFRRRFPYVMIVAQPDTKRLAHRVMDGYVMSSEDALGSFHMPPFDFGCRCRAVPIPADLARRNGLTGAHPVGTLDQYLAEQGASPVGNWWSLGGDRFMTGIASGFARAGLEVDVFTQVRSLREKAEDIRRTDPAAWAALAAFLLWLFSYDVLREDPEELEEIDEDEFY